MSSFTWKNEDHGYSITFLLLFEVLKIVWVCYVTTMPCVICWHKTVTHSHRHTHAVVFTQDCGGWWCVVCLRCSCKMCKVMKGIKPPILQKWHCHHYLLCIIGMSGQMASVCAAIFLQYDTSQETDDLVSQNCWSWS